MKENRLKEFLKSKGFYVSLIVAVSLVIVLAGILAQTGYSTDPNTAQVNDPTTNLAQVQEPAVLPKVVSPSTSNSANANANAYANANAGNQNKTASGITPSSGTTANNSAEQPYPTLMPVIAEADTNADDAILVNSTDTKTVTELEKETTVAEVVAKVEEEPEVVTTFAAYTADEKMQWPIEGDIVMDFSTDHLIYDLTLNTFRTNDSIAIKGQAGDQVKAAAAGQVVSITEDPEKGYTAVIDHGNGWKTTYSQLQENILVDEGSIVTSGQIIGGINNPTKYGILLGDHLNFTVTKDGVAQNPSIVLVDNTQQMAQAD